MLKGSDASSKVIGVESSVCRQSITQRQGRRNYFGHKSIITIIIDLRLCKMHFHIHFSDFFSLARVKHFCNTNSVQMCLYEMPMYSISSLIHVLKKWAAWKVNTCELCIQIGIFSPFTCMILPSLREYISNNKKSENLCKEKMRDKIELLMLRFLQTFGRNMTAKKVKRDNLCIYWIN